MGSLIGLATDFECFGFLSDRYGFTHSPNKFCNNFCHVRIAKVDVFACVCLEGGSSDHGKASERTKARKHALDKLRDRGVREERQKGC